MSSKADGPHFCTDISEGSTATFTPCANKLRKYVLKYFAKHEVSVAYEAGCCGFDHSLTPEFIYYY